MSYYYLRTEIRKYKMRRKSAFTLIELLVVIAIIALLMAILIPALSRVKKQAQTVACQANLHQWALIWHMYTDDNNGYFPRVHLSWRDVVEKYHQGERDMTLCPVATKLYTDGARPPFGAWEQTWGGGQNDYDNRPFASSYGINQYVYNATTANGNRDLDEIWRTPNVKQASQVLFFGDCAIIGATPEDSDDPPQNDGDCGFVWSGAGANQDEICRFVMNRHNGYMNDLFLDWSTRKVGLKELWTLKWHRKFNTTNKWTKAGGAMPEDWPSWMRRFKDY